MTRILILLLAAAVMVGCTDKSKKSTEQTLNTEQLAGGYDKATTPTKQELQIFHVATKNMQGQYIPIKVSRQVVKGTNYLFMCRSTLNNKPPHLAFVKVFAPLPNSGQPPRVINVEKKMAFGRKRAAATNNSQ